MSTSTVTSSTQRSSIKSAALITNSRNACCHHSLQPILLPPRPNNALLRARALGGRLRYQSAASGRGDSTAAFADRGRAQHVLAKPSASPPACRSAGLVGGGCVRGLSGCHDVSLGSVGRRGAVTYPTKTVPLTWLVWYTMSVCVTWPPPPTLTVMVTPPAFPPTQTVEGAGVLHKYHQCQFCGEEGSYH